MLISRVGVAGTCGRRRVWSASAAKTEVKFCSSGEVAGSSVYARGLETIRGRDNVQRLIMTKDKQIYCAAMWISTANTVLVDCCSDKAPI
jgi:hypothetical protein